ncbi:hypothetical protein [Flavobacterium terrisoli]|uniref:hypothetical protein n=1 Tax=Flavobacterium terrisoli TaxID=3242195 RepID=UPI002542E2B7|nr:hypothetical protein [Flavobacterium buctense]
MKKALLFLLLSASAYSQIIVGEYKLMSQAANQNKAEKIELLKSKKTLFVLPPTFSPKEYASVISEVWDITPYEIIWTTTFDETPEQERMAKYDRDYNFFKLTSTKYTKTTQSGARVDYLFNTMDLKVYQLKKTDKNGRDFYDSDKLATIFFTPSIEQRQKTVSNVNPRLFLNYDLGYLRTYLKIINDKLKAKAYANCFFDFFDKEKIKALQTQKLYIPETVAIKYNAFSRTEGEKREEEELLKDYKFPYEIVTEEKLNELMTDGQEIYFLNYVQVNGVKLISVINSKSGDIIYNANTGMSYNIKAGDFKSISKKIDN